MRANKEGGSDQEETGRIKQVGKKVITSGCGYDIETNA